MHLFVVSVYINIHINYYTGLIFGVPSQSFAGAKITVIPWNVGSNLFPRQTHGTVLKLDCHDGVSRTRLDDHNVWSCPNSCCLS